MHDGNGRRHLPVMNEESVSDTSGKEKKGKKRKKQVRKAYTINIRRFSKRELERGRLEYPETDYQKPRKRSDCTEGFNVMRPCPFVSCKHHLYLDVNEKNGSITLNFGRDSEVEQLVDTCGLDVADRGGHSHVEAASKVGLTGARGQQMERRALAKIRALAMLGNLSDWVDAERVLKAEGRLSNSEGSGDEERVFGVADDGREALQGRVMTWGDDILLRL